jgi:hypothetical protein
MGGPLVTPDQVLLKAADIIARTGHHKFGSFAWPCPNPQASWIDLLQEAGRSAPVSVMGAIERAVWGTAMEFSLSGPHFGEHYDQCLQAQNYFARWVRRNGAVWADAWSWNDDPDVSADDVVRALRQAARDWPSWSSPGVAGGV